MSSLSNDNNDLNILNKEDNKELDNNSSSSININNINSSNNNNNTTTNTNNLQLNSNTTHSTLDYNLISPITNKWRLKSTILNNQLITSSKQASVGPIKTLRIPKLSASISTTFKNRPVGPSQNNRVTNSTISSTSAINSVVTDIKQDSSTTSICISDRIASFYSPGLRLLTKRIGDNNILANNISKIEYSDRAIDVCTDIDLAESFQYSTDLNILNASISDKQYNILCNYANTLLPSNIEPYSIINDPELLYKMEKTTLEKLPLELFDLEEYELHTPEEWISIGPSKGLDYTPARSVYFLNKSYLWLPCSVVSYDKLTEKYTVVFSKDDIKDGFMEIGAMDNDINMNCTKQVKRLALLFEDEDATAFSQRLELARFARNNALSQRRLHAFIQQVPNTIFSSIRPSFLENILHNLMKTSEEILLKSSSSAEALLEEVKEDYNYAMKCAIMMYSQLDTLENKRTESLRLAEFPRKLRGADFVSLPDNRSNYHETKGFIESTHFMFDSLSSLQSSAHSKVFQDVTFKFMLAWNEVNSCRFISLDCPEAMNLYKYQDFQENHFMKLKERLANEWREVIINLIRDNLTFYDLFIRDELTFRSSPLYRVLKWFAFLMRDQLTSLVTSTLDEFVRMFESFSDRSIPPSLASKLKEKIEYLDSLLLDSQILESNINAKLDTDENNQPEIDEVGESELNEILGNVPTLGLQSVTRSNSTNNYFQNTGRTNTISTDLNINLISNVETKKSITASKSKAKIRKSKIGGLNNNVGTFKPLFNFKLTYENNKVAFQPEIAAIEPIVSNLMDILSKIQDIYLVDNAVAPLLGLAEASLCSQNSVPFIYDIVQTSKEAIAEVIKTNLTGPQALALVFAEYEYLLGICPEEYASDWFSDRSRVLIGSVADRKLFFADSTEQQAFILGLKNLRAADSDDEREKEVDFEDSSYEWIKTIHSVEDTEAEIQRLIDAIESIRNIADNDESFGLISVNSKSIKDRLINKSRRIADKLLSGLAKQFKTKNQAMVSNFEASILRIRKQSDDVKDLAALKDYMQQVETEEIPRARSEIERISASIRVLNKFHYQLLQADFDLYYTVFGWPKKVQQEVIDVKHSIKNDNVRFEEELSKEQDLFRLELTSISKESLAFIKYGPCSAAQVEEYASQVDNLLEKIAKAEQSIESFKYREQLFGIPVTEYAELDLIKSDFDPFSTLWTTHFLFQTSLTQWMTGNFMDLDAIKIETNVQQWFATSSKLEKTFVDHHKEPHKVAQALKESVAEFRKHVPIIRMLRNPGLRPRHWTDVSAIFNKTISPENLSLTQLLEMNISAHLSRLEEICTSAEKEYTLDTQLDAMVEEWKPVAFEVLPFKSTKTYIVRKTDAIALLLDDQIVKTQTMRGSPYIKPLESKVKKWEAKLQTMSGILEEWLMCQKTWMYLEPIFSSEDIIRQMPQETRRFQTVDQYWRKLMDSCKRTPNLFELQNEVENIQKNLVSSNELLDQIMKGLNDYLSQKCLQFPRFFFLSNDELLSILSQTKNPLAVQPHMNKCFEGIASLEFTPDLKIVAMNSAQDEKVVFNEIIDPESGSRKGNVELWLKDVERVMRQSLIDILIDGFAKFDEENRSNWVVSGDWPGQIVLAVTQTMWTFQIEEAIRTGGPRAINNYVKNMNNQLSQIVDLVRGKLGKMERLTIGSLVVVDVHARDVSQKLAADGLNSANDFDWLSQLRYYFEDQLLAVRMVNATLNYGYEYLGNSDRLVITPLTDRCYRTLIGALYLCLGGAPEGPAGTGKTETVKDLAKAVAKQCVVFNCSDGLTFQAMAKFFKGLAAAGAWSCFDEFNRIDLEVLSVIAQQVMTIQQASLEGKKRFIFEGTDLPLDPTNACFITMNPGYAGRSDLPDNLKCLFRTVAMMVPDYAQISEIVLYSNGYEQARPLSQKIVACLRLSSEQLSSQDHYDFGMRTVKSILTAAGALRRNFPTENEEVLCLRAIMDCNLPKFVASDIVLFNGITKDLFPSVELPNIDYSVLKEALTEVCISMKLQPTESFFAKLIQLYETILVRHGLMVVGGTFSGKTSAIRVLAAAMNKLAGGAPRSDIFEDDEIHSEPENKDSMWRKVHTRTINPKSISLGQLYGQFNNLTGEWTDGVLNIAVRKCVANTTNERKWVVFDGPVDAIWIENLNTVLDDNKKLCLANSEIIKITDPMTMMFEVEDLSVASPATVSRCGMVFMEAKQLGWKPLVQSWIDLFPASLSKHSELILSMFEWFVPPALALLNKYCKAILNLSGVATGMQPVKFILDLLSALLADYYDDKFVDKPESLTTTEGCFIFSFIWAFGSNLDVGSRNLFSNFLRRLMSGKISEDLTLVNYVDSRYISNKSKFALPEKGSVFDYRFERQNNKWENWMDSQPAYKVPDNSPFHTIIVPTIDTVRYSNLLHMLISNNRPVMLVGATGTAKTITMTNKLLNGIDRSIYIPLLVTFSAQTSANQTQDMIDAKLDRRRKGIFGPPLLKRFVVFVDDLNMPVKEKYSAQPPIEILRQFMDHSGWFDRKTGSFRTLIDVQLVTAMGPPGGGRNQVTQRLLRHFDVLGLVPFDDDSLKRIFSTILSSWMRNASSSEVSGMCDTTVNATVDVYNSISKLLLPTPTKSHYLFNLRDLSKAFQGIMQSPAEDARSSLELFQLWAHECSRVFADRLISSADHDAFDQLLAQCSKYFKLDISKASVLVKDKSIYADFANSGAKKYKYCAADKLKSVVQEKLDEYNQFYPNSAMNLVLFSDAVAHVARISRILQQPFGNALLVGVGGSGRQSLTRLASFISEYETIQVEVTKSFTIQDWKDALISMFKKAGIENKSIAFLFTDNQIKYESFLEDINNILNNGEVPNLFNKEDTNEIIERCSSDAKKFRNADTPEATYAYFVERCRKNLHIVLCLSPIGDALRTRLRMFPSLVNCTTIDWFHPWPQDALQSVALTFVKDLEMPDNIRDGVVTLCVEMQAQVQNLSNQYLSNLRRYSYVTPTSYLDLLKTFQQLYSEKKNYVYGSKQKYENGLKKLTDTAVDVKSMQIQLEELKPKLVKSSAETHELMKVIEVRSAEAEQTRLTVQAEEKICNAQADAAQKIKDSCQSELDSALPILREAELALSVVKKSDLVEVKSLRIPPKLVGLTLQAVCIFMNIQPLKVGAVGAKTDDWWTPSQKELLNDPSKLLDMLKNYDKDHIDPVIIDKLTPIVKDESFQPVQVAKQSQAVAPVCKWVHAMVKYDQVARKVKPMQDALGVAEGELRTAQHGLARKQAELQSVLDMLAQLQSQFDEANNKKKQLEFEANQCSSRLERAEKLLGGLGGERDRWTITSAQLDKDIVNIVGNILVSSGVIAYLGVFSNSFRQTAVNNWFSLLKTVHIPCSEPFQLEKVVGDAVMIRSWNIQQLPNDSFSINNGIIMSKSTRFPLFIDPQGQAVRWIKNMEKSKNLKILKLSDSTFSRVLETCFMAGVPMLVEGLGEQLDPVLEPILLKQWYKQGAGYMIKMPDGARDFNPSFKLYLSTKLSNPHYTPEISTKVCLINFMITPDGLGDQMLGITVSKEVPALELERSELVVKNAENARQLTQIEDKILDLLNNSKGMILDDEDLINTLQKSKVASKQIEKKMEESAKTEERINKTREEYRPLAFASANLFFCVADMAAVDPMYQYSLNWFLHLYSKSIENAPAAERGQIAKRAKNIEAVFMETLYRNICRSLFEKDKMLFSLSLCMRVKQFHGQLDASEWRFFLTGGLILGSDVLPSNPSSDSAEGAWLDKSSWEQIFCLSKISAFDNFYRDFANNINAWHEYCKLSSPHTSPLPGRWEKHLNSWHRLLLLRCLRLDILNLAVYNYIQENMGQYFLDPPPFDLPSSYADSNSGTPLVFILSPGADPIADLFAFGESIGFSKDKCFSLSLGQGQGVIAENAIREAVDKGTWVILQNCHLAASWMPTLDRLVEEINPATTNENFRLWLTSKPSDKFPASILQNGVKMTNEPPRGIRNNLLRSYRGIDKAWYQGAKKPLEFRRLLFSLCFFHAIVQERRKFGSLGWNIPYEFNESDLHISLKQLKIFLDSYEEIPFKALNYIAGQLNYGGRVTDDKDRRCITKILELYYCEDAIKDDYKFSVSGVFHAPVGASDLDATVTYIQQLPRSDPPEVFGLHENANITSAIKETNLLLNTIVSMQPRESAGVGISREQLILNVVVDIIKKVPDIFDLETVQNSFPVMYEECMNTVLVQEVIRYNKLLSVIRSSLSDLEKALNGTVVMGGDLEIMSQQLFIGQVPDKWTSVAYPSLKPLGSWVTDLVLRIQMFQNWITNGAPPVVSWISGFFFTQSFLTGALQNYARKHSIAIDQISFDFVVLPEIFETKTKRPEDGVYITGLFLEGASWDMTNNVLDEAKSRQLQSVMPVIWLKPMPTSSIVKINNVYSCPTYKTSTRAGTLSTTGHSTNFVLMINLPSSLPERHWVMRGVALLCQLDN